MSVHVVIQPLAEYGAEVVSPSPGVRQLVARAEATIFLVQVPARIGGLSDTARFARSLAAAANEFGEWCETQNCTRSQSSSLPDLGPNTRLDSASIGNDTNGSAAE